MLTSLFRRSTPFNYSVVILAVLMFFFIYHLGRVTGSGAGDFLVISGEISAVFLSIFLLNFIVKRNNLTRDSGFAIFFYVLFLLFFPSMFSQPGLLAANFFVLLAMRRLISMTSPKAVREKIFDASLWIFLAALFHFWAITLIVLVFISILFHVSRDYRNWVLPFIAFFCVSAIFGLYALAIDSRAYEMLLERSGLDYSIDYFATQNENIALSVYAAAALFFTVSMVMTLSNRPLQLQSSFKKVIGWFVIGVFIFVVSPMKTNNMLIFTVPPMAVMAAAYVEHFFRNTLQVELALWLTTVCALGLYFLQL